MIINKFTTFPLTTYRKNIHHKKRSPHQYVNHSTALLLLLSRSPQSPLFLFIRFSMVKSDDFLFTFDTLLKKCSPLSSFSKFLLVTRDRACSYRKETKSNKIQTKINKTVNNGSPGGRYLKNNRKSFASWFSSSCNCPFRTYLQPWGPTSNNSPFLQPAPFL